MKKKIMALLMATAMVAGLAACGGTKAPAESKSSTSSAAVEASQETPAEVRDVALTVWAPSEDQSDETGNWLKTMCERFSEEHPEWNITFTYGVCAEGDAKATVTQDVEAAADVYMYANDNLPALLASNAIAELGGSTLEYINTYIPESLINSVSTDGAVYGIPFTSNTWFMYYNKSIYSDADVASMETMLEKGKVAFPITNSWYIASFYVANGCSLFGDGTNEAAGIDFAGDKAVAVTNYLVDLVANANFVSDESGAGIAGLTDGSIGAMFSGSWDYQNVVDAIGAENVGAAQLPSITIDGAAKTLKAFAGSKAIGVNPHSKEMEAAVALAAFLGGEEGQRTHYEMRSIIPANTAVAADETDVVAKAQGDTIKNTSVMQPLVTAMNNYWSPADNFGKALVAKEITHTNAQEMTENLNTSLNSSVVD